MALDGDGHTIESYSNQNFAIVNVLQIN